MNDTKVLSKVQMKIHSVCLKEIQLKMMVIIIYYLKCTMLMNNSSFEVGCSCFKFEPSNMRENLFDQTESRSVSVLRDRLVEQAISFNTTLRFESMKFIVQRDEQPS